MGRSQDSSINALVTVRSLRSAYYLALTYTRYMLTVAETPAFAKLWPDYWSADEHGDFCAWIAANPLAGDVVPGTGGVRKVRWTRSASGKRGGVRVVYYNRVAEGRIWLLLIYAKSAQDNLPAHVLKAAKEMLHHAED